MQEFKFSSHGIKNKELYSEIFKDFIEWCKSKTNKVTFSTCTNGEPVFFCNGVVVPYSRYLKIKQCAI